MGKGKEIGECSKHKELEWKAAEKKNCATYDSLELIDFPVRICWSSIVVVLDS